MEKQMTKKQFRERFNSEKSCASFVLEKQLKKGFKCKCNSVSFNWREKDERFYCAKCYSTASIFKNTIFYNSHIKLLDWFEIIYLVSISKNGLSAKEVERQLGCSYRIAWRMLHKIRIMLNEDVEFSSSSQIEIDETYVGGRPKNWSKFKRMIHKQNIENLKTSGLQGRSTQIKDVIIGFYERESQKVILKHIEKGQKIKQKEILNYMLNKFSRSNIFYTDEAKIYSSLYKNFEHYSVDHSNNEYVFYKKQKDKKELKVSTNSIESFWAIVKRAIKGSYIHISSKHFKSYLNEFSFKFNNRNKSIFECIINNVI